MFLKTPPWRVPESEGHDDFITSAALCAWAARDVVAAPEAAILERPIEYQDGRY